MKQFIVQILAFLIHIGIDTNTCNGSGIVCAKHANNYCNSGFNWFDAGLTWSYTVVSVYSAT